MKLPREQKEQFIRAVQDYFIEERGEVIGDLAAELLLDYVVKMVEPVIYNEAIQDAVKLTEEKLLSLEDDLHALEKSIKG